MDYKLVKYKPWFWPLLEYFYPAIFWERQLTTFGNTIYCAFELPKSILVHEMAHLRQQRYSKFFGFFYLLGYHFSKKIRYKIELEAFVEELKFLKNNPIDWQDRFQYKEGDEIEYNDCVAAIAMELSGPVYKYMVSFEKALEDLLYAERS